MLGTRVTDLENKIQDAQLNLNFRKKKVNNFFDVSIHWGHTYIKVTCFTETFI